MKVYILSTWDDEFISIHKTLEGAKAKIKGDWEQILSGGHWVSYKEEGFYLLIEEMELED